MNRQLATVAAAIALALATVSVTACSNDTDRTTASADPNDITALPRPQEGSVEAGFARDMSVHHAQAVAMAEAIRDRTEDPDLRILATDIALGQQGQIGRMSGWLDEWGLAQTSTNEPMGWIRADNVLSGSGSGGMAGMPGMTGDTMVMEADGRMPGMATRPQVTALGTLPIDEAEVTFLQLMIAHHLAGVDMAHAALARTSRPDVIQLATSIVNGQQSEIEVMTEMLAKRGATP